MQAGEQGKRDVLTDPALVLLGFPVQLKGSNGAELGKNSPKEFEVQYMAKIDPDENEKPEVRSSDVSVDVVECFGGLNA